MSDCGLQGIERVAAFGDIHANAQALEAAVATLRDISPDVVVVLGDVLSYGCEPGEVLELLSHLTESFDTRFVLGNHDEIYRNVELRERDFEDLDGPVSDSIRWTINEVGTGWSTRFTWYRELVCGGTLFSHANPFGAGDWTYINSTETARRAIDELERREIRLGVFGHTHRQRLAMQGGEYGRLRPVVDRVVVLPSDTAVVTLGSIGQPRDEGLWGSIAVVTGAGGSEPISVDFTTVEYDIASHIDSIQRANLPETTRVWLRGFFDRSRQVIDD